MRSQENEIMIQLKSRFFDIIDAELGLWQYESILFNMLLVIKEVLKVEEVSFYSCNDWKHQGRNDLFSSPFLLEGTSQSPINSPFKLDFSLQEFEDSIQERVVCHKPLPFK